MKYLIAPLVLLSACTLSNHSLSAGPMFKVSDSFSTDSKFYLGKGTIKVTKVSYGPCENRMQWMYYGEMQSIAGLIQDVEICENELQPK